MPAEEHRNAASEDVEPGLLVLRHHKAPLSKPHFPVDFRADSACDLVLGKIRTCHGELAAAKIGRQERRNYRVISV